jgi:phosphoserine phosphatase
VSALPFDMVVFDVDGTLVDDTIFVWETLHRHFASDREANRRVMQAYLDGEISYADWFEHDIDVLKAGGATRDRVDEALADMRLMAGARETLSALGEAGVKTAIISGSLDLVVDRFFPDGGGFVDVFVNHVRFDDEGEIVSWEPTPFDMDHKADGMRHLSEVHGIPTERMAFVGDNFNDLSIARAAGRAVAFNAKSLDLQWASAVTILERDLRLALPFLLG